MFSFFWYKIKKMCSSLQFLLWITYVCASGKISKNVKFIHLTLEAAFQCLWDLINMNETSMLCRNTFAKASNLRPLENLQFISAMSFFIYMHVNSCLQHESNMSIVRMTARFYMIFTSPRKGFLFLKVNPI